MLAKEVPILRVVWQVGAKTGWIFSKTITHMVTNYNFFKSHASFCCALLSLGTEPFAHILHGQVTHAYPNTSETNPKTMGD